MLILLGIGIIFISTGILNWLGQISFDWTGAIYGLILGIGLGSLNVWLDRLLPERVTDDGGLNQLIFHNRKLLDIFLLCCLIGVAEELVFRGIIQFYFGFLGECYFIRACTFSIFN